ncbi:hypothetical protein HDU96_005175 [Phlyctochytrium bullatum]|nr:hypothetical protein HDU96_005175 [Phlyctochytrium bullatum]
MPNDIPAAADTADTAERRRLAQADALAKHWRRWGPYLSERAWATVRDIAHTYQERLFGVTGPEGNHGEDVKEAYFYVDNVPTHAYMKYLYKYPHREFPYSELVRESVRRGRNEGEFELLDTGIFDEDRYFDVVIEYGKDADSVDDLHIVITVHNRSSSHAHPLHLLPTLWYRNTWSWGPHESTPFPSTTDSESDLAFSPTVRRAAQRLLARKKGRVVKPQMYQVKSPQGQGWKAVRAEHATLPMWWAVDETVEGEGWTPEAPTELLFCENETNLETLYGVPNKSKYAKDGINERVVHNAPTTNPDKTGTKCAAWFRGTLAANSTATFRLRLTSVDPSTYTGSPFAATAMTLTARAAEADAFYADVARRSSGCLPADLQNIQRQAFAGMLWSKQFYHYVVKDWLDGDPGQPPPPAERKQARNKEWRHLHVDDILSMPDKWEYPFFAAWDTAFHAVVLSMIDPWFAKKQLILLTREWYLHPNGQLPAYEWNFSDVNPPVHAWAAFRIYKIERKMLGGPGDRLFLERMFQKLLLNFTWWVNRKDSDGNNVFEGGFLGLDNIAVFNRSETLPIGGRLRQADGTAWMAMFSLNMLSIALELAPHNRSYEDIASKFFEHFMYISDALSWTSPATGNNASLWDDADGFYYDNVQFGDGLCVPLKVRSLVGLIPLFAVLVLEPAVIESCPDFKRRMQWFLDNFDFTKRNLAKIDEPGQGERILLSLVSRDKLERILSYMLDENEFLSPYGIRSLSKYHQSNPYIYYAGSDAHRVDFLPAESDSGLFGGNSNWRGPIWFPTTFLLIESLERFHYYYGDALTLPCPTHGGPNLTLDQIADEIMRRAMGMFVRDEGGRRAVNGSRDKMNKCPYWKDLVLFYEYFNCETGEGLGASHQTGWTGLVAKQGSKVGYTVYRDLLRLDLDWIFEKVIPDDDDSALINLNNAQKVLYVVFYSDAV